MTELLKLESIQAFEERKAQAKRLGEEAGTKLLLPMFLMLAVVLVIVDSTGISDIADIDEK